MNTTRKRIIFVVFLVVCAGLIIILTGQNPEMKFERFVFSTDETVRYRFPTHINDLVMDRAEAVTSEAFVVVLEPGGAPPLHKHDDTEQIFYVMEGEGTLVIGQEKRTFRVKPGDVVRIPPSEWHQIIADDVMRYLSIDCFVGGRPAVEPTWESHVKVLCKEQGWDFSKVKESHK